MTRAPRTAAVARRAGRREIPLRVGAASAALALALAVVAGCARPGPPPGGPEDSTPPEVTRTIPADGDVSVDRNVVIEVEFSEEMDRQSVERAFALTPEVTFRALRWKGRTLRAEPEDALRDSTTYVAAIGSGARDYHGVSIGAAYSFAFSTGSAIEAGILAGVVTLLGEPVAGALVWVCEGDVTTDAQGVVAPCGQASRSAEDGAFTVRNVRSSPEAYSLVAFVDRNGDGRWETASETGWIVPRAARVEAPADSIGGLAIDMRTPAGASPGEDDGDGR